jgi:hypothetical protein
LRSCIHPGSYGVQHGQTRQKHSGVGDELAVAGGKAEVQRVGGVRSGLGRRWVTRHGEEVVVVVPVKEVRRISERGGEKKMDFKEFLMSAPDLSVPDLERPREMPRDVELWDEVPVRHQRRNNTAP